MSTSLAAQLDEVVGYPLVGLPKEYLPSDENQPVEIKCESISAQYLMVDGIKLILRDSQEDSIKKRADLFNMLRYNHDNIDSKNLLHLFMTYVIPEEMAESCSVILLDRFASLGNLLAAPWQRLEAASPHVEGLAGPLKMLHAIVLAVLREPLLEGPVIDSWAKLKDYLRVSLGPSRVEMVRLLFLDELNRLIADELHGRGTVDHAPLHPYEAARRALQLGARSIILVHNHPTGNLTPSSADKAMTLRFRDFLQRFGLCLHDHVIVGRTECVSLRQLNCL
jgi:DNA repair protein RadC